MMGFRRRNEYGIADATRELEIVPIDLKSSYRLIREERHTSAEEQTLSNKL